MQLLRALTALLFMSCAASVSAVDVDVMARFFGLRLVSRGAPWTFPGVHAVFADQSFARQMLVIENVPGKTPERVIEDGNMVILNLPTTAGHFTSVALINVGRPRVEAWLEQASVVRQLWRQLAPLPTAQAQIWGCERCRLPTLDSLAAVVPVFAQDHMRRLMECLGPMLQGIWESTGGMVAAAADGVRQLVTDPGDFWHEKREQMSRLGDFLAHFDTKIRETAAGISRLPDRVKVALMCSFAGSLGTDALLSILTGGAGLAAVMLRLDRYLVKIVRLERVIGALSSLNRLPTGNAPFLQALAAGRVGDDVIDAMRGFQQHGMTDLMTGAMACPL